MTYSLAKQFAPPNVDLRYGRLADDHGDKRQAQRAVKHRDPYDVSLADLEYYFDVWRYLEPTDLLFYSYAVLRFLQSDQRLPVYFERWIEVLDCQLPVILELLSEEQRLEFRLMLVKTVPSKELEYFKRLNDFAGGAG